MPIHIPINILDFIFKGMMIGMIASAPMGPVGILCVQRTLNKGRWYGMATGVGAAVSDILYAGFAGFGMSFVMDLINNDENRFYLQMGGSIMLLCFGLYTYKSDPTKKMHKSGQQKGTLWYNTWTASSCSSPSMPSSLLCCQTIRLRCSWALPVSWVAPCCGGGD